ncbi:MAG: IS5 family transposase, partial [Candidatus Methanomethylicia archaeon]
FLEGYDSELTALNRGKVGHPFKITVRYVEFLMVVRYLFSMPYRQLEGFTKALNRLIPKLPSVDYSWIRRRILTLNPSLYDSLRDSSSPITIAVDSSGVSVHKSGGWVTRMHGKKKRYIKIHFAVDVKTKEILAMDVTTDDVHDSEALPALIKDASKLRRVSEAVMDGAYDNSEAYNLLRRMGVKPIIKPRHNARDDRGPPERRRAVRLIRRMGDEGWAGMMGYGRRWAVETTFSTFKRQYGEYCMAKTWKA